MSVKAVIDTNVFVSALWSANPASPPFRTYRAMLNQLFVPLYSDEIIEEYEEVLHRSKFGFDTGQADEIIDIVRRFGERVIPAEPGDKTFPDPDDKVFYCVALAAQDETAKLVTGNTKHFPSAPFVVSPAEFAAMLDEVRRMRHEAFVSECLQSKAEYEAGLGKHTTAKELMADIMSSLDDED